MSLEFPDNTVLIDSDGMPWRSYFGRFKSIWSCQNSFTLSQRLAQPEATIKEYGITAADLVILNYGPWRLVTDVGLVSFDLDAAVMENILGD